MNLNKVASKTQDEEEDFDLSLHQTSVEDAFASPIIPVDFVLPGLPIGEVGLLASSGGTGKSFYALQAIFQVTTGHCIDFNLNARIENTPIARVMYVSLEDKRAMLMRRLQTLRSHWSKDDYIHKNIDDITDLVNIFALAGLGKTLINEKGNKTKVFNAIVDKARSLKGLRLIVIDTLRRSHDCDENSNGAMSKVLRNFEEMAEQTGASVLLLHHENKGGAGDAGAGASAIRGASAIVDNARYAMRLQTMTLAEAEKRDMNDVERKHWVFASLEKSNYSPPIAGAWLMRCTGGVLTANEPPHANSQSTSQSTFAEKAKWKKEQGSKKIKPDEANKKEENSKYQNAKDGELTAKDIFG